MSSDDPEAARTDVGETAGSLAAAGGPLAPIGASVDSVRQLLGRRPYQRSELLIVTEADGRYAGVVEMQALAAADGSAPIAALTDRDWPRVAPETDQEHAVEVAQRAGVAALPVVGADGRPVGVIPAVTLLAVLSQEHREDVHRLVGILSERRGARHALEDPPLRRLARRLPWLLVGLAMSSAATGVMAGFERTLQANVTIAFFIPALVYLTDAIGTQTEAIAVRGLSLRSKPLGSVLAGEVATGGLIGLALGVIAVAAIWLIFSDLTVAVGVGISLFAAGTLASSLGLLLPWLLSRLGMDPAFGSGPVATIIQDVLTILIYFAVMTGLLTAA